MAVHAPKGPQQLSPFIVRHLVQRPCSGYLYGQEVILCFSESEGFSFLFSFEEHFIGYIAIVAVAS